MKLCLKILLGVISRKINDYQFFITMSFEIFIGIQKCATKTVVFETPRLSSTNLFEGGILGNQVLGQDLGI